MHLQLAIALWFIFISQGSSGDADSSVDEGSSEDDPASRDMYSTIMCQFPPVIAAIRSNLLAVDIIAQLTNCFCEIITDATIPTISFYLYNPCAQLLSSYHCILGPCFCANTHLNISPTCNSTYDNKNSPLKGDMNSNKKNRPTCQTLMNFMPDVSTQLSNNCSNGENAEDFVFAIQWQATGLKKSTSGTTARSTTPVSTKDDASSTTITPTLWNYSSATTEIENQTSTELTATSKIIIGVVVGVGGAVLLTIAIVIVVLRRRRVESSKLYANNGSQANAVVPNETAYASYTIPVSSAAYDNATNGTTSNYESIAGDNEEVGELNHAYTEVKEISDHNGYDNSETGRSDVFSMCRETGENYEIVSENPTANTESETTVIDNDFYG